MLQSLLKRFSEPSSYAGLTGMLGMLGLNLPAGVLQYGVMGLAGLCGVLSILLAEKGSGA